MKQTLITLIILGLFSQNFQAQNTDSSLTTKKIIIKTILPATLITGGILLNNSQFEKDFNVNLRNKVGNDFEFRIDDFIQFVPIAEMYGADLIGIKAKNHWFDQSKNLFISSLLTTGTIWILKRWTNKTRPSGARFSFPSGHTTFAFTNATVLYNEFHQTSPVLAYSGYFFATTTGTFRMLNNKHWLSDVLAGAGIGIILTNLVYYVEPLKNFNPFIKSKNITFIPQFNNNQQGFYFCYKF